MGVYPPSNLDCLEVQENTRVTFWVSFVVCKMLNLRALRRHKKLLFVLVGLEIGTRVSIRGSIA
jgi:hypothetical protein